MGVKIFQILLTGLRISSKKGYHLLKFDMKQIGTLWNIIRIQDCQNLKKHTLPETNIAPENGWLEYDRFLLGNPIFRGYVSLQGG